MHLLGTHASAYLAKGRSPGAAALSPAGSFGTPPRSHSASRLQTAASGAPSSPAASQASLPVTAFAPEPTTPAAAHGDQVRRLLASVG